MDDTTKGRAPSPWLSVRDAAAWLGIDESTVYRLCRSRKIPHRRLGAGAGRIVFTEEDLAAYLEACRVPVGAPDPGHPAIESVRLQYVRPQGSPRPPSRRGSG